MENGLNFEVTLAVYGMLELIGAVVFAARFRFTASGVLGTVAFGVLFTTRLLLFSFGLGGALYIGLRFIATALLIVAIYLLPISEPAGSPLRSQSKK